MKIAHNWHGFSPDRTDPAWAERVEREAEVTTNRAERTWEKAQERLARATARAEREAQKPKPDRRLVKRLWALVAARRDDLKQIERLANQSPAGSQNRGQGSHRGVATGEAL